MRKRLKKQLITKAYRAITECTKNVLTKNDTTRTGVENQWKTVWEKLMNGSNSYIYDLRVYVKCHNLTTELMAFEMLRVSPITERYWKEVLCLEVDKILASHNLRRRITYIDTRVPGYVEFGVGEKENTHGGKRTRSVS